MGAQPAAGGLRRRHPREVQVSKKYEAFVAALAELCKTHGVQISTSGYDAITVNDLPSEGRIGDEPIYLDNIEDNTTPEGKP